ncbi:MAG TPA: DNA gyrase subunit A [Candidatus Paceibacterota bacterium]|nr:DNA gyrase subunit A [Candidatus Paceibacterota bacterium]
MEDFNFKTQKIQKKEITEELQESYLDYAMSVIISRALPDVRDGLKPVHRRILYSMYESGFTHGTKFHKSANVVGEVLGKYHPHGDAAVYDALARMAQNFSLRYPMIEGQGNWGSIDGDAPAAMRYTEARLSLIAEEMLKDLDKETVDFLENYDATRKEPQVLPAKLPQLLINGTSGIAVGMATNIPPHNLSEVSDAVSHLIEHPQATTNDLLEFVKGPDFPTGGVIYNKKAISEAYSTGRGRITLRAATEIQEKKHGQYEIIVSEIPYQVNKSELLSKIADLIQEKKIEGIKDIRDESDKDGLSVIIQLKNDSHPQKVLNNLFKHTDLQKDFYLNMLSLVDGIQPQTLSLKAVLENFIKHRQVVIRRRCEFDLKKAEARKHILEGLAKALKNIDAVIKAIKSSKDKEEAQQKLIKNFKLSPLQADAILEMRLQTLVGLERQKIEDELKLKEKEIAELKAILKDPKRILKIVKEETEDIKKRFGDERRTKVVASAVGEFKEEDLVPAEENIVMMSQDGFIKRFQPTMVKSQKRGGRGVMSFETKEEDNIQHILQVNTHDNLLFFTTKGRVFQLKAYEIPQAPRTSRGKSIYNFIELPQNEPIAAILSYNSQPKEMKETHLIMLTKNGIIKKVSLEEFGSVRRSGLIAMKLRSGDELCWAKFASAKDEVIILTANGQALRFKESDLRPMGRNASGVTGLRLKKGDEVCGFDVLKSGMEKTATLLVAMSNGFGKQTPVKEYRLQRRAGQGTKTAKVTEKTGKVVAAQIVPPETKEVLVISKKGILIKTNLETISQQSRVTQGVRIIKLEPGDAVAGIVWL